MCRFVHLFAHISHHGHVCAYGNWIYVQCSWKEYSLFSYKKNNTFFTTYSQFCVCSVSYAYLNKILIKIMHLKLFLFFNIIFINIDELTP